MCMQDIQIGRNLQSRYLQVAVVAISQTQLLPANPRRVAFTVNGSGGSTFRLRPVLDGNTDLQGFTLNTQANPHTFRIEDIGNMVCQAWEGFGGAGQTVSIIECELTAQSPEQLRK